MPGLRFNVKSVSPSIGIPVRNITRFLDRLIFMIGIPSFCKTPVFLYWKCPQIAFTCVIVMLQVISCYIKPCYHEIERTSVFEKPCGFALNPRSVKNCVLLLELYFRHSKNILHQYFYSVCVHRRLPYGRNDISNHRQLNCSRTAC